MIPDRACVQFGIGVVPATVAAALTDRCDLGIHSELMSDSLMALIRSGAVSNRYKAANPHKSVFNIAMGSQDLYTFLDDNPAVECHGADYVNDPYVIAQNDNVVSINAFIEIDLHGAVNAEFLDGRQYSAPGGQLDFVRGARMSTGGLSVLAAGSTASGGTVSRIVPRLTSMTTDPRTAVQYIATEFGICDLEGKSTSERARALIELAHPDFRADLTKTARAMRFF